MRQHIYKSDARAIAHIQKPFQFTMKSLTRPNESFSISELVTRSAHGLPLSVKQFVPMYHGEEMPNLKKLDISEAHRIILENRQKIQEIQKGVEKRRAEAQNRRLEEMMRAKLKLEEDEKNQLEMLQKKYQPQTRSEA